MVMISPVRLGRHSVRACQRGYPVPDVGQPEHLYRGQAKRVIHHVVDGITEHIPLLETRSLSGWVIDSKVVISSGT